MITGKNDRQTSKSITFKYFGQVKYLEKYIFSPPKKNIRIMI
jgi:hypothetical protein